MGTLTSASVFTFNVRLRTEQCKKISWSKRAVNFRRRGVIFREKQWSTIRCCAVKGEEGENEKTNSNSSSTSASTTTEEPDRRGDEIRSEQTPASVSPRVFLSFLDDWKPNLFANLYVFLY